MHVSKHAKFGRNPMERATCARDCLVRQAVPRDGLFLLINVLFYIGKIVHIFQTKRERIRGLHLLASHRDRVYMLAEEEVGQVADKVPTESEGRSSIILIEQFSS